MRHSKLSFVVLAIIAILSGIVSACSNEPEIDLEPSSDLIKTVAHVDLSDVDDLELVYKNAETDVAYYMYIGEHNRIDIGDTLYTTAGDTVTVTYTDVYGFHTDGANYIVPGMSGTGMLDSDGNIVGLISSTLDNNEVYCIWY